MMLLGLLLLLLAAASAQQQVDDVQISYVLEPFESLHDEYKEWYKFTSSDDELITLSNSSEVDSNGLTDPSESVFGINSLKANYTLVTQVSGNNNNNRNSSWIEFGKIQQKRPHNCHGATHLSIWYRHDPVFLDDDDDKEEASFVRMRVFLYDDTVHCIDDDDDGSLPCTAPTRDELERVEIVSIEQSVRPQMERTVLVDWQQALVDLDNMTQQVPNLRRLRGWAVSVETTTSSNSITGILNVDQLECIGGGDLLGAVFYVDETYYDAVAEGTWQDDYFQSNVSKLESFVNLTNGLLDIDYTVEQVETWGGYTALYHLATGSAYYNLTGHGNNNHVALNYHITSVASIPDRAIVRFLLQDNSHCTKDCDFDFHAHERYYSFHKILDLTDGKGQLQIPLIDSVDPGEPFWLTTWSGIVGNREMDLSTIKGFTLEFVLDAVLDFGDLVHGSAQFSDLQVLSLDEPGGGYFDIPDACVWEPQVHFAAEEAPHYFQRIDFVGNKCCQTCAADPECLYAMTDGRSCYVSHAKSSGRGDQSNGTTEYYDFSFVRILNIPADETLQAFESYWMDDATKRGDFCDFCDCNAQALTIDCRGANLRILPKTVPAHLRWSPRVLDLRQNPELFLLGTGSLMPAIASKLEVLYLPANMRFLSLELLKELPALASVHFELLEQEEEEQDLVYESGVGVTVLDNAIAQPSGAFGDVCCTRGTRLNLQHPNDGLVFCDLQVDAPGIDSIYIPFVQYIQPTLFKTIFPTSPFLSEAAESLEKCAEYCAIVSECHYFNYDARIANAEHICNLLLDNGTEAPMEVCCDEDHYSDENKTLPGWVAGKPPQTRRVLDSATVQVLQSDGSGDGDDVELLANADGGYAVEYQVRLGSTPLRGAVWIEPTLATSTGNGLDVDEEISIWPQRVALYDSTTTATVQVQLAESSIVPGGSWTLILQHAIQACDTAFRAPASDHLVYIQVIGPPAAVNSYFTGNTTLVLSIVVPIVVLVLLLIGLGVFLYFESNRRKNDSVWKINVHELQFGSPPEIVGRGTFGMVLQAEYRGTQVAVKRVIPPKSTQAVIGSSKHPVAATTTTAAPFAFFALFDGATQQQSGGSGGTKPNGTSSWGAFGFNSEATKSTNGGKSLLDCSLDQSLSHHSVDGGGGMNMLSGSMLLNSGTMSGALVPVTELPPTSKSTRAGRKKQASEQAQWRKLRKDFIAEMRYLSKLRHPCITTVMGAVIDRNVEPMMVMELMDHGSLYDILHNETMLVDGEIILPILQDIAKGILFLHSAEPQVIHGDLKAANILVDAKFRAKVADFGLSNRKQQAQAHAGVKSRNSSDARSSVAATGTPFWMAPELLRGESANTTASDIYSFGIIIYECFSRKEPYYGEVTPAKEILQLVASLTVNKRPSPIPSNCPPACKNLMMDCLLADATQRPTAAEMNTRLKRVEVTDVLPPAAHSSKPGGRSNSMSISLFDIFPKRVAEALRDGRPVEPEHRDLVTIFFSDIVGFTNISASFSSPAKVANMLDRLYGRFDQLTDKHNIFKVETIGDAYMAVTNLVEDQPRDHAKRIAQFAVDAVKAANETLIDLDDPDAGFVNIRVGFHSGPVVADVVGSRNPRYCLFGDTVNTAARMESNSKANRIHCSMRSADLLREQCPELALRSRGMINIKGKGEMHTFWVTDESVSKRRLTADRKELLKSMSSLREFESLRQSKASLPEISEEDHNSVSTALDGDFANGPTGSFVSVASNSTSGNSIQLGSAASAAVIAEQAPVNGRAMSTLTPSEDATKGSAMLTLVEANGIETVPSSGASSVVSATDNRVAADSAGGISMTDIFLREAQRKRDKVKQIEREPPPQESAPAHDDTSPLINVSV